MLSVEAAGRVQAVTGGVGETRQRIRMRGQKNQVTGRKEWIMKAVMLTTYGDPATGLEYRDVPEPQKPGVGQVLVGVEFAPINFSDILVARGLYPLRTDLPSVIGNEALGRVLEIGPH